MIKLERTLYLSSVEPFDSNDDSWLIDFAYGSNVDNDDADGLALTLTDKETIRQFSKKLEETGSSSSRQHNRRGRRFKVTIEEVGVGDEEEGGEEEEEE